MFKKTKGLDVLCQQHRKIMPIKLIISTIF